MTINIRSVNMELTPAIRAYVEEKINALEKFAPTILQADVDVGLQTRHHQKGDIYMCSVSLEIPGETEVMKIEREAEDLYKAIDKVKDHFRELLVSDKERQRDAKKAGSR